MTVVVLICILFIVSALCWKYHDHILGILPWLLCGIGAVLYLLAYIRRMSLIDWVLILCGVCAAAYLTVKTRKDGVDKLICELKRQFLDSHLWVAVIILAAACVLLRGEKVLEWDGYNVWGPDTKGLYYHDGFAPKYSNPAPGFGNYTPMAQIIWWWFAHLGGVYDEQYVFFGYYIFGALMLFSVADKFRAENKYRNTLYAVISCVSAVVLPGVACTAWYRALCVDPLSAILFGAMLSELIHRPKENRQLWRAKLLVGFFCLPLIKSVAILSALLAAGFCFIWLGREKAERKFGLACLAVTASSALSWVVFCRLTDRTGYLSSGFSAALAQRLSELKAGTLLIRGSYTRGYISSYIRAFISSPIHREKTWAIDLSPLMLLAILFLGAFALWKVGCVPKGKIKPLIVFMVLTTFVLYAMLGIGQLTMFYDETQYLEPANALTLMTRYCSSASIGLLMLLVSFSSGHAEGADVNLPSAKQTVCCAVSGALILSCGAYVEMGKRFIFDPLDEQRIEKRNSYRVLYEDFLEDIAKIPIYEESSRVLLGIYGTDMNPIVVNEASPVSFVTVSLSGDVESDISVLIREAEHSHSGYLYLNAASDELVAALSEYIDKPFMLQQLYRAAEIGELSSLYPVE